MKRLILSLLLIPCISCLTTSEVYLPHTSRIFHKKNCVDLHDPNPIKYSSAQVALNTEGVAACSVCIKDKDLEVKSKSSVAIRVLGDILVFLGVVAIVAISASATPAQTYTIADNYEVSVTRKGSNLYKVDGKNIFIHTRYCYEYGYNEDSLLQMNGYSGEIIFLDSGNKCDVKAVYGSVELAPGNYSVTIDREDDDWYEIWGQGIYIKTSACLSLALGEDAVLSIATGGFGTLYVEGDECMVEGVYSKMRL